MCLIWPVLALLSPFVGSTSRWLMTVVLTLYYENLSSFGELVLSFIGVSPAALKSLC